MDYHRKISLTVGFKVSQKVVRPQQGIKNLLPLMCGEGHIQIFVNPSDGKNPMFKIKNI